MEIEASSGKPDGIPDEAFFLDNWCILLENIVICLLSDVFPLYKRYCALTQWTIIAYKLTKQ